MSVLDDLRFRHPEGDGGANADPPAEGAKPDDTPDGDKPDGEIRDPEKERLSRESAGYRTKLREVEAKLQETIEQLTALQDEKLTASEREAKVKQKAEEARQKAEREAQEARRELMAFRAATRFGLSEEFLPALSGQTQDEVDESAERVKKAIEAKAKELARVVPPNLEGGARNGKPKEPTVEEKQVREFARTW